MAGWTLRTTSPKRTLERFADTERPHADRRSGRQQEPVRFLFREVVEDFPHLAQAANGLLDDMSWWTKALKPAREVMTTGVAA